MIDFLTETESRNDGVSGRNREWKWQIFWQKQRIAMIDFLAEIENGDSRFSGRNIKQKKKTI